MLFAALVAMLAVVVGVPLLLVLVVGNPWPGSSRLAMGDEAAVVVGVLTVLVWLVWARFVVAVVVEVHHQLAELRARLAVTPTRVGLAPPPPRSGTGLLAQRLVAAVLVLLPLGPRGSTAHAEGAPSRTPGGDGRCIGAGRGGSHQWHPPLVTADVVTVGDGDTLFGLARTHLGDSATVAGDLRAQPRSPPARRWSAHQPEPDPHRVAPRAAGDVGRLVHAGHRVDRRRGAAAGRDRRGDRRHAVGPRPSAAGSGRARSRRRRGRRLRASDRRRERRRARGPEPDLHR